MRKAPRVFVVDDESTIRETLAAILYNAGYEAIPFADGDMALSASAEEESPDLLITDVIMPDMNGVDLAINFENLYPKCKILLLSGAAAAWDLLASARLRARHSPHRRIVRRMDVIPAVWGGTTQTVPYIAGRRPAATEYTNQSGYPPHLM